MSEVHQIGERSEEKNIMLLNVSENVCEESRSIKTARLGFRMWIIMKMSFWDQRSLIFKLNSKSERYI